MTAILRRVAALALASAAAGFSAPVCADTAVSAIFPGQACLSPATWFALDGKSPRPVSATEILSTMARGDVVLLGEQHDAADHHRWQLQTLAALHVLRPRMVIGFESFPRRVQPALERWIAGALSEKAFLEESQWEKVWNLPHDLYMPLFQFARINRIPIVALNVERELTRAISEKGWEGVPDTHKEGVTRPAPATEAYKDYLFEIYKEHPRAQRRSGDALQRTDSEFLNFVDSQTTWDRAMAEAMAKRLGDAAAERPLVVGIMGGGHIRNGYGVPHQLRDLGVKRIGTLLPFSAEGDCKEIAPGFADAVFALPQAQSEKPPPPRLGVRLEQAKDGVTIVDVTEGSLAEKTGLRAGDSIAMIAGVPVTRLAAVIGAVRAQPDGTWLPIQVKRGGKPLDFVIKFPPKP